jgi:hypothetical protein
MKKFNLLLICFALSCIGVMAQAVITFETKEHDFGNVDEDAGLVTYVFKFKNEGNEALVLTRVQASCGCTTPDWTKTPVEPGQTGEIKISYNPKGRPGNFLKSVTVLSNAQVDREVLLIKGNVSRQTAN